MKVPKESPNQDPRRRMPRHETDAVRCALGDIVDLSGTGMRVAVAGRCPLKVGQVLPIKLKTPNGALSLAARTVWRRRTGLLGGYQVGFNFDGITPQQST
ncbi:MAG: PilZ domain-containing protein, partial [Planctomycetota bacterium]